MRDRGVSQTRDRDVRSALHATVLAPYHVDPDSRVINEFGLWYGLARVDIAVVNGLMHGYEIKSDRDTLDRLPEQARIYSDALDRVTLVVGATHVEKALAIVPTWWGVKLARGARHGPVSFADSRPSEPNPRIDPVAVAALLWGEELLEVLVRLDAARGVRGKSRDIMSRRLATVLPLPQLREEVRARLKARSPWRADVPRT